MTPQWTSVPQHILLSGIAGGVFSRFAEVIFHPGNERLTIKQEFEGIDEHDHLVLNTKLDGHVPVIPPKNSVEIKPYKEVYQYSRNCKNPFFCNRLKYF